MPTYKTPGVYVEEISTLPPSVAEVSTAVPAFVGYTERGTGIVRLDTLLDFEEHFGGPPPCEFSVVLTEDAAGGHRLDSLQRETPELELHLYYALSHYFDNGGGSCYVVSVGNYDQVPSADDFRAGLQQLETEDEPTLIVLTDAVGLATADYQALCQLALAQCDKLGDRFAILDVPTRGDEPVQTFRDGLGTQALMYGAAYYPDLQTSLSYRYREENVVVERASGADAGAGTATVWARDFGDAGITVRWSGSGEAPQVKIVQGTASEELAIETQAEPAQLTLRHVAGRSGRTVAEGWATWVADGANSAAGFDLVAIAEGSGLLPNTNGQFVPLTATVEAGANETLATLKDTHTAAYNQVKTALAGQRVVLPPSAAVAGVYAQVDRDRGVWKAPANVGLASVIAPTVKVTHEGQEHLNVDPTGGKSINAIRAFSGKGTLVWGARTLAGNDNEWRYVSVRRLFNMIEESTRKATGFAVFEPNDMATWLKVQGMIESYLYGLWEQGAFAGPTPEAAYFVHVGLGKTMTPQDVLEGRMVVEIGVAAVRPAEFIVLRFSHKLQEA